MTEIKRRGFLKLGTALVGGLALARYAEPPITELQKHHDWIEDKGDYLIVRVPDFKTFADETLNKPTIFLLGQAAAVDRVDVTGYANVYAPKGGRVYESRFDGSQMTTENPRPLVVVNANGLIVDGCSLIGAQHTPIDMRGVAPAPPILAGTYRVEGT